MLNSEAPATALVAVAGLSRTFESAVETTVAVEEVDLQVSAGEFVLICGPSGSGKTTLLNLIAGIDTPDSGQIEIDGNVLPTDADACARLRLETIGIVFQDDLLIDEFSVIENVQLPLEARSTAGPDVKGAALSALAAVGVDGLEHRFPDEISGGQRQRVGIARAIVGGRRILLADEPTGALDSANSLECFRVLRELCNDGRVVIVSSHDPQAREFADRCFEMVDGRLSRIA